MGKIHVTSEIAPLKKVLLHRPGKELLNLTPDSLNRLLFDDIPYLPDAIKEHDEFADLLRQNGVEVVYLEDLMADVLDLSEEIRDKFIKQFVYEAGIRTPKYKYLVIDYLDQITNSKQLVLKTMEGIQISDISRRKRDIEKSLIDQIDEEDKSKNKSDYFYNNDWGYYHWSLYCGDSHTGQWGCSGFFKYKIASVF